jgi:hypothetical protein
MAVFNHSRAFDNAAPIDFRPAWGCSFAPAAAPRLVCAWCVDSDGQLVRRWRLTPS